jgi:hypothetical protein
VKKKAQRISFATWQDTLELNNEKCLLFCDFISTKFEYLQALDLKSNNQETMAVVCDALGNFFLVLLVCFFFHYYLSVCCCGCCCFFLTFCLFVFCFIQNKLNNKHRTKKKK